MIPLLACSQQKPDLSPTDTKRWRAIGIDDSAVGGLGFWPLKYGFWLRVKCLEQK